MWTGLGLNLCAQSLTRGTTGLRARAQRATFSGSADVIVEGVLQAAAQAANVSIETTGGVLDADAQAATFAGSADVVASGVLDADAQAATFDGDGEAETLIAPQLRVQVQAAVITLGGTMRATGGGPATTLTGTLVFAAGAHPGIKVEITTNGTAGSSGEFRVSYNSGSTWAHENVSPIPTTYNLDGAANGVTINFSGAYTTSHSYEGAVATIRSTEGSSYTFTNATAASQPVLRKAAVTADGKDALFFAGAQLLRSTDAAVLALFTNDPALTVLLRVAYTTADAAGYLLCAANSGQATNSLRGFGQTIQDGGSDFHTCTSDAGVNSFNESNADIGTTSARNLCWVFPGSNGGAQLFANDVTKSLTVTTCAPGTLTPNRIDIGDRPDSSPGNNVSATLYDLAAFSSALSAADQTAWHNEMA